MNVLDDKIKFSLEINKPDKNGKIVKYSNFEEWKGITKSKIDTSKNGLAVLTGEINDITVIDFDGDEGMEYYNKYFHLFENTFIDTSTNGFKHAYFLYDPDFIKKKAELSNKIDTLNNGKCCVIGTPDNNNEIQKMNPEFKNILLSNATIKQTENATIKEYEDTTIKEYEDTTIKEYEDIEKVKELVKILTEKESDDEEIWIKVGMTLKNIIEDDDEGYDIWNDFSKLSKQYNLKKNKNEWKRFKTNSNLTIKSIIYYITDKKKLKEWNKKYSNQRIKINKIERLNKFDLSDEYDFEDFKDYLFKTKFANEEDAVEYFENNLYKSLVKVNDYMITKQPEDEYNNIHKIEHFNRNWRAECLVKYIYFNEYKDKYEDKYVKLIDFLEKHPHLINSFKRINTEFIEIGEILKEDSFYITEEFQAEYIENLNEEHILKIQPLLDMIMTVYCNNEIKNYELIMSLFSFWMCNPNKKSGKCLILVGEQGTGKSTIIDFFMTFIISKKICMMLKGFKELLSDKNGHLSGKKLINVNECKSKKGDYFTNFDDLKTLISDDMMSIRGMYKETKCEKSSMELIITTNNANCCPIEKRDRKYIVVKVNDIYIQKDDEYWGPLREQIWNQDCANIFYSLLINMKTTERKWRAIDFHALKSELKDNLIKLNQNSIESFMTDLNEKIENMKDDILQYDKITPSGVERIKYDIIFNKKESYLRIKIKSLYDGYISFCKENGEKEMAFKYFNFDLVNKLGIERKLYDGYNRYKIKNSKKG